MAVNVGTGILRIIPMTTGVSPAIGNIATLLAGLAAVSTKMAYDFEKSFQRISAVTDTSQKQIAVWREQVMSLSGDTAQSATDLADALYFLASAGLDTSQIMPTLEASAKAAASGLGETADIARLAANVLNAYPDTMKNATEAVDILVAAVREGTAEPDEFASAMGRILPIASKAGVEFDQLAASLAALSNIGLDVNEGVTAMRGLLQALSAPGSAAADALADVGISTEEMRRVLAGPQGLIGGLRLLEERTGGNIDKMRTIVPNIRALTGALGLTGQEARKVNEIFREVAGSTGALDEAFRKTQKGPAFKFDKALNDLKNIGIELGVVLLPIITEVLSALAEVGGKVAEEFGTIKREVKDVGRDLEGFFDPLVEGTDKGILAFDSFMDGLVSKTDAAFAAIGDFFRGAPPIDLNNKPALAALKGVVDGLRAVQNMKTRPVVDANIGAAMGAINSVTQALNSVGKMKPEPKIGAEAGEAFSVINSVRAALSAIPDEEVLIAVRRVGAVVGGLAAQHGFHGVVRKPTIMSVAEAGPERVDVKPLSGPDGAARSSGAPSPSGPMRIVITDWERGVGYIVGRSQDALYRDLARNA